MRSQESSTAVTWDTSAATTATPISLRPVRSNSPTSAAQTSNRFSAATIGLT